METRYPKDDPLPLKYRLGFDPLWLFFLAIIGLLIWATPTDFLSRPPKAACGDACIETLYKCNVAGGINVAFCQSDALYCLRDCYK